MQKTVRQSLPLHLASWKYGSALTRALCLVFVLVAAGCFGGSGTEAVIPAEPPEPPAPVVVAVHASTNPETSRDAAFVDCIRQEMPLPEGIAELQESVAGYISRFYGNTDAFRKAERCDSFILKHNPTLAGEELKDEWYHVALFTYKDNRYVTQLRALEKRNTTRQRVRATEDRPGVLTFKENPEGYRIVFGDKRVVMFFYSEKTSTPATRNDRNEDPVLFEAAQNLKECLLQ